MPRRIVVLSTVCLVVAGCGEPPAAVPQLGPPAAPHGFRQLMYPAFGVALAAPRTWSVVRVRNPLVALITSGGAVISLWHYERTWLPAGASQLRLALRRLSAAAGRRDRSVRVIRSATVRVDDHPGFELEALERVEGRPRRVWSVHVFTGRREIVLEEYAPPGLFGQLNRTVFSRVRQSLVVSAR